MKQLLVLFAVMMASFAYAAETKEVCTPVKNKAGMEVKAKDGSVKQRCKKIKIHKKVSGEKVPEKK